MDLEAYSNNGSLALEHLQEKVLCSHTEACLLQLEGQIQSIVELPEEFQHLLAIQLRCSLLLIVYTSRPLPYAFAPSTLAIIQHN